MKVGLALATERLTSQFWVLPTVVALFLIALLFGLQSIGNPSHESAWSYLLLYDASPAGARLILSSIATALMTVVGVLFSITIVVLQQVSTQYSPRLLQSFVRSLPSQVVLGFYIGTFCYCLLLLRKIHDEDSTATLRIPELAMSGGIVLAIACLCLLIYYIHHIASAIKSTSIISGIVRETGKSLAAVRRECGPFAAAADTAPGHPPLPSVLSVRVDAPGYLQAIEWRKFGRVLGEGPWEVEVLKAPGDYLQKGEALLRVFRPEARPDTRDGEKTAATARKMLRFASLGNERNHAQDPRFGVRQLVDIALRALSPAVNDPTTATEALHGLCTILLAWAEAYPFPTRLLMGPGRIVRLSDHLDPAQTASLAYDQVVRAAEGQLPILGVIEESLELAWERSAHPAVARELRGRRDAVRKLIGFAAVRRASRAG